MTSLSAFIVDDEPKACNVLKSLIRDYCTDISDIQVSMSPDEALQKIPQFDPDILFLDINMPEKTGFDLLDELERFDGKIVFTTAYHQYAIKAFKYCAFDYLLKPVRIDDLVTTVERIITERLNSQINNGDIKELFKQLNGGSNYPSSIAIHDKGGMVFLNPGNIIYLEGQGNYTKIHCTDKCFMTTKPIKSFEQSLDPELFLRVHKSYIVNIHHVLRYLPQDGGELILTNNLRVQVSRRKRHLLERFTV
ncbi:MAG: response regulator transcription factor [Crocinitomicaceae bacterium]|nr:response regulator transcription factor [Crocinitomicaceae bacterium]